MYRGERAARNNATLNCQDSEVKVRNAAIHCAAEERVGW